MSSTRGAPSRAIRKPRNPFRVYLIPLFVLQFATFLVPLVLFFRMAFFKNQGPGLVDYDHATFEYLGLIFVDPYYQQVVLDTVIFGLLVTVFTLLLGFPIAYCIARAGRFKETLLIVVIVTSFTSVIIKVLGWKILLGASGPINSILQVLGIADEPLRLVNNLFGAVVGTVHAVLPLIVLLLVPVVERVPVRLEEAAAGLGARRFTTYWSVVLPAARIGLVSGGLVAFAYAMGSFTTPALLGGKTTLILPILIRQQAMTTINYPMSAALSITLVVIVAIVTVVGLSVGSGQRARMKGDQ